MDDVVHKSNINVIGNTTSVVDFRKQEVEYFVRNHFRSVEENFELSFADIKIFIRKSIRNVPTNSTKLSSILYDGMEVRYSEQKLFEFFWLYAIVDLSA